VDAWDGTALRCMVHRGDTETVKFLLENGANIFAIENKVIEVIERQGRSELAKTLRDGQRLLNPSTPQYVCTRRSAAWCLMAHDMSHSAQYCARK
jgi:hypothetical protein